MTFQTADLCDEFDSELRVLAPMGLQSYGGRGSFSGPVATLKVYEDNSLVRSALEGPGEGRVLVVDGGGSMRCAMVGDQLALLGVRNGWAGILVYGCIRDSAAISEMDIGLFALATHPRKSVKRGVGERDVSLCFGGIEISPGDHLYADSDGVVLATRSLC